VPAPTLMVMVFLADATSCAARPMDDVTRPIMASTCFWSIHSRVTDEASDGLFWWLAVTSLIGWPSTSPPKSLIAILAAVIEPGPDRVLYTPDMSVRMPTLT